MSGDLTLQLHERRDAMKQRRQEVEAQIGHIERWERQLQPPVVEQLKAKTIEVPPQLDPNPPNPFIVDANSPMYRGDPYIGQSREIPGNL
jgi:hypothetical protein